MFTALIIVCNSYNGLMLFRETEYAVEDNQIQLRIGRQLTADPSTSGYTYCLGLIIMATPISRVLLDPRTL